MVKIEQDGFYLNAMGEIVKIELRVDGLIYDESGNMFYVGGESYDDSQYDLIGYIPPELHYSILKTINGYHKNKSYKSFVDREFKKRTK